MDPVHSSQYVSYHMGVVPGLKMQRAPLKCRFPGLGKPDSVSCGGRNLSVTEPTAGVSGTGGPWAQSGKAATE